MDFVGTFIALVAAVGTGTIVSAIINRQTTISTFRQAWINALRDELAEYFRALENLSGIIPAYLKDSEGTESRKAEARTAALIAFEKIRLRLNKAEELHIQLEKKLREFIDEPLGQAMHGRRKIDEAADLARTVLKAEWEVAKHPWRTWLRGHPTDWRGEVG